MGYGPWRPKESDTTSMRARILKHLPEHCSKHSTNIYRSRWALQNYYCEGLLWKSDKCHPLPHGIWNNLRDKNIKPSETESRSVVSNSLRPPGLYSPWNSPGQNTGVGSLSLLQGIFPPQGSNPGLPHYRWMLYQLTYEGSPRILEWVTYPFSSRSFWPRNQTWVSCIAGRFFTNWAMREAP